MEKSIILIGKPLSGKTKKSRQLAKEFPENEVVFIENRFKHLIKSPFFFSDCSKETKLIIVDEIRSVEQLEQFKFWSELLTVQKRAKLSFEIKPKFILVCDYSINQDKILSLGESFARRFDVIECNEKHIDSLVHYSNKPSIIINH